MFRLADHRLDALDATMTVVESFCDLLRELLDLLLLFPLRIVVIKSRKNMLLMQFLQALAFCGDIREQFSDLVGDVSPARG